MGRNLETEPRDRPETEIEVTPEMIEAGLAAYYAYDHRLEEADAMVAKIYRAMMNARAGS